MLTQLLVVLSLILPNTGNIYKKTISFSLFGKQTIETKMLDKNLIAINLNGLLNDYGYAKYNIIDNKIYIDLSDNLKIIMKTRNTEFKLINYDSEANIINIYLNIKPLYYKKIIELERIN